MPYALCSLNVPVRPFDHSELLEVHTARNSFDHERAGTDMFFYKKHYYSFQLKPSLLGSKLKEKVKQETVDQLEGQCLGKLGYVIKVRLTGCSFVCIEFYLFRSWTSLMRRFN